ncbi:mucin-12 [Hyalella azteca]|uniref:Mucin-12 n=1 Tax=Hyalella azteca TaxID=294128 RepID=A0A8B7NGW1_HYAAZ|nr:mucin-12 [Hyalella azteca]
MGDLLVNISSKTPEFSVRGLPPASNLTLRLYTSSEEISSTPVVLQATTLALPSSRSRGEPTDAEVVVETPVVSPTSSPLTWLAAAAAGAVLLSLILLVVAVVLLLVRRSRRRTRKRRDSRAEQHGSTDGNDEAVTTAVEASEESGSRETVTLEESEFWIRPAGLRKQPTSHGSPKFSRSPAYTSSSSPLQKFSVPYQSCSATVLHTANTASGVHASPHVLPMSVHNIMGGVHTLVPVIPSPHNTMSGVHTQLLFTPSPQSDNSAAYSKAGSLVMPSVCHGNSNDFQPTALNPFSMQNNVRSFSGNNFSISSGTSTMTSNVQNLSSYIYSTNSNAFSMPISVHSTPSNVFSIPSTQQSNLSSEIWTASGKHSTPSNVFSMPNTVHSTPSNVFSMPNTVHSNPNNVFSMPNTVHSTPSSFLPTSTTVRCTPSDVHNVPICTHAPCTASVPSQPAIPNLMSGTASQEDDLLPNR